MTERLDHLLTADRDTLTRIAADPDTPPDEARLAAAILNEQDAMHASIDVFAAEHPADPVWLDAAPRRSSWHAWAVAAPLVLAAAAVTAVVAWPVLFPEPPSPDTAVDLPEAAAVTLADCGGRSLQAPAMMGRLKPEQIACLRSVDDPDSLDMASRTLIAHYFGAEDQAGWESQVEWHLQNIQPVDPDMAAKASRFYGVQGDLDRALELARLATTRLPDDADALQRSQAWGAHTQAAAARWQAGQEVTIRAEALQAGRTWLRAIEDIEGQMRDHHQSQAQSVCTEIDATPTCEETR